MTEHDEGPITVSVVVPVYSGQDYLMRLAEELDAVRTHWEEIGAPLSLAELILVDDASIDGSPAVIDRIAERFSWVMPLHLSRNYGQHPATVAGILFSAGNWVITMDEDLQHPPSRIAELLACAAERSADVVYAQPTAAVHRSALRDRGSAGIKQLISWLTGANHVRFVNSFRLIRGEIARSAASVAIHDTYFDIELGFFSQRFASLPMALVDERYVRTGKSGYGIRSLIAHAWRMVFSAHLRLLRFAALLGAFTTALALFLAVALVVSNLVWPHLVDVRGWASQMVAITFFGGVNTVLIGIALQYLSTLVLRAHGRPTFFVVDRSKDARLAAFFASRPT